MNYIAKANKLTVSYRKLNKFADVARGKNVDYALAMLKSINSRSAVELFKVIHSAKSNAENNFKANSADLVVREIKIGRARLLKRLRFASHSKTGKLLVRQSNIYVILN